MPTQTQDRPTLTDTVQQLGATQAAALLSLQLQTMTAAGTMLADKDMVLADATAGTFIVTLPETPYIGKVYAVKETSGANQVTVDAFGAGTIDGAANIVIPAREAATFVAQSIDAVTGLVTWSVLSQTDGASGGTTLLAANNLGDVANAATARANLGANTRVLLWSNFDFVAANAQTMRVVWRGPNATITNIDAVADLPTDGTVIITASIEGTPVTNGVATIPLSISAGGAGSAVPTAANVITAGQRLVLAVSGTNTLITLGEVSVWVTY